MSFLSYAIVVDIFDSSNNRIYPSDNIVMEVNVPKEYFALSMSSENGTFHAGSPLKVGTAEVSATLIGVRDVNTGELVRLDQPLHAYGQLIIFDEIQLSPSLAAFPWDPLAKPVFSVMYSVSGSPQSEINWMWTSSNQSVATVTQNGIARTQVSVYGMLHFLYYM